MNDMMNIEPKSGSRLPVDLASKFYPVLSSLQRCLRCSPILGQRELEFSGVKAQLGGATLRVSCATNSRQKRHF